MIAIIGAMDAEINLIKESLKNRKEYKEFGDTFYKGILDGKAVVVVKSGIGKVNAAKTAVSLLNKRNISAVIFTGVAGGLSSELKISDIVISTKLVQHDVDVRALGYHLGEIPDESIFWEADEKLQDLAWQAAKSLNLTVHKGIIASGDQFIADKAKARDIVQNFDAKCTEMEGASVAQICKTANVPFVVIRAISDSADHEAKIDYREFFPQVAKNAKAIVKEMLKSLE